METESHKLVGEDGEAVPDAGWRPRMRELDRLLLSVPTALLGTPQVERYLDYLLRTANHPQTDAAEARLTRRLAALRRQLLGHDEHIWRYRRMVLDAGLDTTIAERIDVATQVVRSRLHNALTALCEAALLESAHERLGLQDAEEECWP